MSVHVVAEAARRRVVTIEPTRVGADPEPPPAVDEQAADEVVVEGIRVRGVLAERRDAATRRVDAIQAGARSHPQRPRAVLGDGRDERVRQRVEKAHERVRLAIVPVEAPLGAGPQHAGAVDEQIGDRIVRQAAGPGGLVQVAREAVVGRIVRGDPP